MTETATPTTAVAQQQASNIATKPMSIKDTVLAQFKETEAGLRAMAEKYRNVVYDVTTTKGMNDAKAARAELRDDGRRMLTRTEAAVKADVNELKKVMGDEVERLVAIVKPVEDAIDAQIKAEEKRKADEKAERDRKEAERVGAHRANIEQLKAYVEQAEGQPVEVIEKAIAALGDMTFGEEWEEFAQEAEAACLATVQRLLAMVESEKTRIENARLQRELEEARAALAAQAPAPAPAPVTESAPASAPVAFEVEPWGDDEPAALPAAEPVDPLAPARQRVSSWAAARNAPAPAPVVEAAAPGLNLGTINERLGGAITTSAEGLRILGFEPAGKVGAHGVYREADFPLILAAMVRHIEAVQAKAAA
ncbi:hypothetical protein IB236_12905 [Acidovorax sp. ACV02]|uniref:hypothetical protein n=1 Tax=Acidovorax sp. ACV02 TaxID=2769310 RepID=UPI00178045F0|nr:hypothetical protein [Acidovorax sp. ACV02]MBD9406240.1 hypothetical protein [Acidovorax sp. ACV02]